MLRWTAISFLMAILAAAPAAAQRMYKCVDAKGKIYYTQVPPTECLGRETQELDKGANVIKRNQLPLSPEQQAEREAKLAAERKQKEEAEQKAKEERRMNQALLNTYSSEKDIEEARGRAVKENEDAIKETEKRIEAAKKRQKELDSEKEFYANKPLPRKLSMDIQNLDIEIKTQLESLDARRKQENSINAKYDEDKKRYIELTKGNKAAQAKK